jgi:hypothetical protein
MEPYASHPELPRSNRCWCTSEVVVLRSRGPKNMLPLPSDNDSDPWFSNTVFAAMVHVMGLGDFDDFLQMGEEVDKSDWSDLDALKNFGD